MQLNADVRGHGYPLLCLHGHPGNAACMRVFTEKLSQRYTTISPDLRGYGHSRMATPFTMTDHLADLNDLLDRFDIQQCLVLGWSLGGILAMELALQQPQRVAGLMLLGTAARPRGNHPPISWQDNALTAIASLINKAVPGWQWNIDTFGQRSLYRYLIQQHTPQAYQRLADEAFPAFLQTSRHAQQALNQALRAGYDRLPELEKIAVPSLVLCGECDRHITARASQETAQHLPHSSFKQYPQTAHLFPWEIPKVVLADLEHWLQTHF
ncbi:alpha/beta fold hydrolase [Halomicronema sp. CCY15110]|uniref:alpha/beta fold hydrolase n=1 Tax=Halomicronema sp. CCY15110 TaxID=2767773 RepID=UPI0019512365|nr:alpha/beta hydrolase [Halomicronema sp. CCY15110]